MQLEDIKGLKKHKWVAVDPNTKFVNVDLIKEAIGEAEKEEARAKAKEKITTRKGVCSKGQGQFIKIYVYRGGQP